MELLILHLIGDYLTQSDWMANSKTIKSWACFCHGFVYALPFLLITSSIPALFIIGSSHFLIDRFRLAKYLVYTKNFLAPPSEVLNLDIDDDDFLLPKARYSWENCKATGYPSETPVWLAVWLMIIADNTLHLIINYLAIKYL